MLADLRTAIDRSGIELHFQPKLDLVANVVSGAEVLARWNHPTRGSVPPIEFIKVAEESGLIRSLTDLVLEGSIGAIAALDAARPSTGHRRQPLDPGSARRVAVRPHRTPARTVRGRARPDSPSRSPKGHCSTTGRAPARPSNDCIEIGVHLSIDDFGTGYSSLSYLRQLPVTELKIDRSFVTNLVVDAQDETIVRSTIDLGHNLGLQVVAEGVETNEVADRLRALGCDIAQGLRHLPAAAVRPAHHVARQHLLRHPPGGPPVRRCPGEHGERVSCRPLGRAGVGTIGGVKVEPAIAELIGDVPFDPDALREKYREERERRLRPDANDQYVEVTAEFSNYVDDPYVEPGFTREPLFDHVEVAIVGGGFGGLLMGARLREAGYRSIRLIEKAGDVGGTWYWNRYPGAMCDVESYVYLPLLEEMGYIPEHKYSFAPEIFEYSKAIARRFDLYDDALFQTGVSRASLGRRERPMDHQHRSRRPDDGAVRGHGERPAEPAEAPGNPGNQRVQGPHVPHQPLGLRLHRRRLVWRADQTRRQAGRDHRHRRDRDPMRPPPGRWCRPPLRVPAHAVVGRCPQQPRDRPRVGQIPRRRLAATADGQLQHPRERW